MCLFVSQALIFLLRVCSLEYEFNNFAILAIISKIKNTLFLPTNFSFVIFLLKKLYKYPIYKIVYNVAYSESLSSLLCFISTNDTIFCIHKMLSLHYTLYFVLEKNITVTCCSLTGNHKLLWTVRNDKLVLCLYGYGIRLFIIVGVRNVNGFIIIL